jgi:PAS domain S-box-containing protein
LGTLSTLNTPRGAARDGTDRSWPRELLLTALLAAGYVVTARLGFRAALVVEQVSPAWPPSGLALWALLVFGRRAWVGIWVGALIANFTINTPPIAAAAIASGNLLEAIIGAWLLREWAGVHRVLEGLRQVTALVILGAVVSTTVAATIGAGTLCAAGLQNWTSFGMLWRTWWLGDAMGDVLFAPLLLTLPYWFGPRRDGGWFELISLQASAIVLGMLVFSTRVSPLAMHPLEYLVFPIVIWAGLRFGHPGAALVNSTLARIAVYGTLRGMGPFGTTPVTQDSIVALQIYIGLTAVSGLVLGAAVADRRRSELLRETDHALATILSEERDLEHATPRILQVVCDRLGWDIGILWLTNETSQTLEYAYGWQQNARLTEFIDDSRGRTYRAGEPLPGRVLESQRPVWIDDIFAVPSFARAEAASRVGVHGWFAFPLVIGTRVLAVVEFFARSPRQVDRSLLALMEAAGAQIGQFMERRRAEQRVAESEALYSAIVNAALDCVVTIDSAGTIIEFNPSAARVFGYSRDEAVGRELAGLIIPERLRERHRAALRRTVETGEAWIVGQRLEMPALRADGSEFPVEIALARVGGPGQPIFTAHMRDITDRKHAERERELLLSRERSARMDAEAANRSKDQFLATVSHELRTPLTAILGWASMLKTRRFAPERIQQIYESLERNAHAQAQIVGDLLDVSRIVTGRLRLESKAFDVSEVVNMSLETIRPTAVAKGVALISEIRGGPHLISGDPARLQQVIWNLLTNGVKFTPAGGMVTLRVVRDASYVMLEVSDTGIGLAADMLPRVFDRFWQADGSTTRVHGGLGLGLALVRHLVELHGGDVCAQSEGHGRGTRFTVRLPARVAESAPRPPAHPPARAFEVVHDFSDVTTLVVDDDQETRELFAELLTLHGGRVLPVATAAEAFEIVQREPVDVVVMDIGLPQENGFSLLKRIRALESVQGVPPVPIVAVTAYAGPHAHAEALRAGFAAYVPKPAPPDELLGAIRHALALPRRS